MLGFSLLATAARAASATAFVPSLRRSRPWESAPALAAAARSYSLPSQGGGGAGGGGAGGGDGGRERRRGPPPGWEEFERMDAVSLSYTRSSGPGGQNVNKLNTKCEARIDLALAAPRLPADVRARAAELHSGRLNKQGELVFTAQSHRTQKANRVEALQKVAAAVEEAWVPPKERTQYEGLSVKGKAKRRDDKRARGAVKKSRGRVSKKDWE